MAEECIPDRIADIENRLTNLETISVGPSGADGSPGYLSYVTYASMAADVTTAANTGYVHGPDGGTHTDPISGVIVPNEGIYAYSTAPAGWQRVANLSDAITATEQAAIAFTKAAEASAAASISQGSAGVSLSSRNLIQIDKEIVDSAKNVAVAAAGQALGAVLGNNPQKFLVEVATVESPLALSGLADRDGQICLDGTSILVWNHANEAENGIYVMHAGAWTRREDCNTAGEISSMVVTVRSGVVFGGMTFVCTSAVATLGVDSVVIEPQWKKGANVQSAAAQPVGVYVHAGDSNTVTITTFAARQYGRCHPYYGAWKDWQRFTVADSGMKLSAIVATIPTGDRNTTPTDYQGPGFGSPVVSGGANGNIYKIINALKLHPNAILEVSLTNNDVSAYAASRLPGASGDPLVLRKNWRRFINQILAETTAHIIIRIPQPLAGEDFIVSMINTTEWAVDSPDGTIATNAAKWSAVAIGECRRLINKYPRVSVVDMPKLVYGADRCDDMANECLDMSVPAVFNGNAIPNSARRLYENSLHPNNLGERREEEVMMKHLGLTHAPLLAKSNFIVNNRVPWSNIVEGEFFHFESLTNSAGNSIMSVRASPEGLAWRSSLGIAVSGLSGSRFLNNLALAEQYLMTKNLGAIKRVTNWTDDIKVWFPASGNTYNLTDVSFIQTVLDSNAHLDSFVQLLCVGANMAAEKAAADGPDLGYPGSITLDSTQQICLFYIDRLESSANNNPSVGITLTELQAVGTETENQVGTRWRARIVKASHSQNIPVTVPTVSLYLNGQGDGRFNVLTATKAGCSISGTVLTVPDAAGLAEGITVSGAGVTAGTVIVSGSGTSWIVNNSQTVGPITMTFSLNDGNFNGYLVGQITFTSTSRIGTWVPNHTNINRAITAGVWLSAIGSGHFDIRNGDYLTAIAASAVTGQIAIKVGGG